MRRPGAGPNRRGALRGIGAGAPASAAPFDPLADPDLFGIWTPSGATDDGTTLTIPNLLDGGVPITATGAGRATYSATGLDGHPGIVTDGMTQGLRSATGALMSTRKACTILWTGMTAKTGTVRLFQNGVAGGSLIYATRVASSDTVAWLRGTNSMTTNGVNYVPTHYPRVLVFRTDGTRATGEQRAIWQEVDAIPSTEASPADSDVVFANSDIWWASNTAAAAAYDGTLGTLALIGRELSDAELPQWIAYLRDLDGTTLARDFLWVGDSITVGANALHAQWRAETQELYDARGDGVRFYRTVGPFKNGGSPAYLYDRTMAASGATTSTIRGYITTYLTPGGFVPDYIPILLGTNDLGASARTFAQLTTDYGDMLDEFAVASPGAKLIAQKLVPRTDGNAAKIAEWNADYHDVMVAAAIARGVNVISDDTLATMEGYTYVDGLHPTTAAGVLMAAAIEPRTRVWAGIA